MSLDSCVVTHITTTVYPGERLDKSFYNMGCFKTDLNKTLIEKSLLETLKDTSLIELSLIHKNVCE